MSDWFSLYLHIPFCKKKCRYCDFYSVEDTDLIQCFTDSLCREIRLWSDQVGRVLPQKIATLYFGGGTPSLLSLSQVGQILDAVRLGFEPVPGAEITFEANPGTVDASYLSGLRAMGVNRLSLGIQSFDDGTLRFLGRIHTQRQNLDAIGHAQKAGFDNIGMDLIYGLPDRPLALWEKDMEKAVSFFPSHLSCYLLTMEPGTPLHDACEKGVFHPIPPEAKAPLFLETSRYLGQMGYVHYEVSNFARGDENRSRHNGNYWNLTPYIGLGPSAHSFGTAGEGKVKRFWNAPDVKGYVAALSAGTLPPGGSEVLTPAQQLLEKLMLGLRTCEGVDARLLDHGTEHLLQALLSESLARLERGRLVLTPHGWAHLDGILEGVAKVVL